MNTRKGNKSLMLGFTLLEAMFVLVTIAALSAIAIPAYGDYLLGTHKKAAVADMMVLQQRMERQYELDNGRYSYLDIGGVSGTAANNTGDCNTAGEFASGNPPKYSLAVNVPAADNGQSYTITATACVDQEPEECGHLRINSDDVRMVDANRDGNWAVDTSCF